MVVSVQQVAREPMESSEIQDILGAVPLLYISSSERYPGDHWIFCLWGVLEVREEWAKAEEMAARVTSGKAQSSTYSVVRIVRRPVGRVGPVVTVERAVLEARVDPEETC